MSGARWALLVTALIALLGVDAAPMRAQTAGHGGGVVGRVALPLRDGQDVKNGRLGGVLALHTEGEVACAASLITPRMLLTSASCVLRMDDFKCLSDGTAVTLHGAAAVRLPAPKDVAVYAEPSFDREPIAYAARIHTMPMSSIGCVNQLALIELDRSLPGIAPLPFSLYAEVAVGDLVRAVGHGAPRLAFGRRRNLVEAAVLEVDADGLRQRLDRAYRGTFALDAGACQSDRGGPVLDADGRIVGVLFGTPGADQDACVQPEATAIATHVGSHATFVRRVFMEAGETLPGSAPPPRRLFACSVRGLASTGAGGLAGHGPVLLAVALWLGRRRSAALGPRRQA